MHKPILFSTEMVQAILEGRKKMTRRILPIQPLDDDKWILATLVGGDNKNIGKRHWVTMKDSYTIERYDDRYFEQKYYKGDILWVRESFASSPFDDNVFVYKADAFESINTPNKHKWRTSIHMSKAACRIFLRVTDVRCERLQEISEQDALDEGIDNWTFADMATPQNFIDYTNPNDPPLCTAIDSFESLWAKINGQQSWDDNPWVWVVSFERCDRPEGFI